MRLLPFIIVFFCVYFIFKSNTLAEKHLTYKSYYKITKLNEEKNVDASEKHKPDTKAEHKTNPEQSKSENKFPTEDFVKECVNQPPKYSEVEVQILENLNERKLDLDRRSDSLIEKERLLSIAVKQAENKIEQLRALEASVKGLLSLYDEKEDLKIKSLVKIYQAMKPKDAAKIFDELDMDILLQVIDKMKEANSALIIGSMNPERAKELTIKLARQRMISEDKK